jgi:hypothetical protein
VFSHIAIILVTFAQLIFFTRFHKYIAWPITEPDGSITRLSMLTNDYFTWLPIMITGSIIVIIASIGMIIYDSYRFRRATEISFNVIGIVISISLLSIFPFDFSVMPSDAATAVVTKVVTGFFIFLPGFYGVTAIIMFLRFKKSIVKQDSG